MKKLFSTLVAGAILASSAYSQTFSSYSTSFTSADSFVDATAINNIDGWASRTNVLTSNVASNGQVSLGANGPAQTQTSTGGALAAGQQVDFHINAFLGSVSGSNQILRFGLSDETTTGAGQVKAGFAFTAQGSNSRWAFDGVSNDGSDDISQFFVNTAPVAGSSGVNDYDFYVSVTKSLTANEFDVSYSWSGGSETGSFTVTNTALYNAATVYGAFDYSGTTNTMIVDSYSHTAVPEPSTFALLSGLLALGAVAIRRRR